MSDSGKLKFFIKEIPIDTNLTFEMLEHHAHGHLRYNNIADLAKSGSSAIQAFLDRANALFAKNLPQRLKGKFGNPPRLKLYYQTVFCKDESEPDSEAFPLNDFIRFETESGRKIGNGVMFSSYSREFDRKRIELDRDVERISESQALFKAMFAKDSPSTGVLQEHPLIMIPQSTSTDSVTDKYFRKLGLHRTLHQPHPSPKPFRYFHKGRFSDLDPVLVAAASAIGQPMFEVVRPQMYRFDDLGRPYTPHTKDLPSFGMAHLESVKWEQHQTAVKWIAEHETGVNNLVREMSKSRKEI